MDNKDCSRYDSLSPCACSRALLLVGDGHAVRGNGEVDITAMETSLSGTFQLIVALEYALAGPRARRLHTTIPWDSMKT